jgi:IclR family pca regulon transcriptional regulator
VILGLFKGAQMPLMALDGTLDSEGHWLVLHQRPLCSSARPRRGAARLFYWTRPGGLGELTLSAGGVHETKTPNGSGPDGPAWSIPSLREPRYSQSLERGLAILGCFTPKRPVLGSADIADGLGMSRSTAHRYVAALVALGYLEQVASRKFRLGLRVTDLGMSALNLPGLREHAHPYLKELRQRTSYSTSLGVLDGTDVLYVDRVRSFRRGQGKIDLDLHMASRLPAYATAMGKLLLANLPEAEQRGLLAQMKLAGRGPNTVTSKKALREELHEIQAAGFAVSDQELAPELYAIAAPVRNEARDVVAAVNLAAPSAMITLEELVDALGPHLVSTTRPHRRPPRLPPRRRASRGGVIVKTRSATRVREFAHAMRCCASEHFHRREDASAPKDEGRSALRIAARARAHAQAEALL